MQPEEIVAQVRQRAAENFKSGLNCPECVLEAFMSQVETGLPLENMCHMTGFGAGMGLFGDTCGALSGAVAALGAVYGRRHRPESLRASKEELYGRPGLYRLFNRLPHEFKQRFGSIHCRDLTEKWQKDWLCREHALFCRNLIVEMAGLAAEIGVSRDLARWGSQPFGENVEGLK